MESVIREVCERVLTEKGLSEVQLDRRATALTILGDVYANVKKSATDAEKDQEYVKVDKK